MLRLYPPGEDIVPAEHENAKGENDRILVGARVAQHFIWEKKSKKFYVNRNQLTFVYSKQRAHLQYILSGADILRWWAGGELTRGTRSRFRGGKPPVASVRKVPFSKVRIALSHVSEVL